MTTKCYVLLQKCTFKITKQYYILFEYNNPSRREDQHYFNADCIICLTDNITRALRMQKEGIHGDVRLQGETIKQELDSKSGMFVVSAKNLPFSLASFPF